MTKRGTARLDRILSENYGYFENWLNKFLSVLPPALRKIFYKLLFLEFGNSNYVGENCYFRYPWKISIGNNVEIGMGARVFPSFKIKDAIIVIEDNVTIAPGLVIFGAGHPVAEKRSAHIADSVFIRKNAYIGGDVLIRYGVEIGEGAVVAAGAVVVSDVNANTTVAGVPAKAIRS
jgi:acetyltransferase-like isoleucine patch superfamily enzyme